MESKDELHNNSSSEEFELFGSVANLEVFYSIISYLDENTIRQLPITTKQLLESKRRAEQTQLYWKERTELMFETPILIDRNVNHIVNWKEIYTLLYQSYERGKRVNPQLKGITAKNYPSNSMFIAAGEAGNFDALEVLHNVYRNYRKDLMLKLMSQAFHAAGSNGHFDVIELMIKARYVIPSKQIEEDGMDGMEERLSVTLVQMVGYLGNRDQDLQVLESLKDFYSPRELEKAIAKCNELKTKIDQHVGIVLPGRRIDWEKAFRFIKYKSGMDYYGGGIIPHVLFTSAIKSNDVNIFNLAVDIILLIYDMETLERIIEDTNLSSLGKITKAISKRIYELRQ
jgi:hypothetical protein